MTPNKIFPHCINKQQLISFLQKEKNPYSIFILEKISLSQTQIFRDQITEKQIHHIQPKHLNGLDPGI